MGGRVAFILVAALAVLAADRTASAQSYSSGQNVSPAYEGWERDADGTRYFLFGYMNRNWEEELNVPVGPDNNVQPGGPDLGQPTRFLSRRNRFVFRVRVPDGFSDSDELVWTLTTRGKTEKAYATVRSDYFIDDVVKASETGALGAGTSSPEVRANKPPQVKLHGAATRTVKVGQPLELVALVTDDGIPKPREEGGVGAAIQRRAQRTDIEREIERREAAVDPALIPPVRVTVGKTVGLHLSWFVYRGAGKVCFDPPQIKVWEDTRAGANSPWAAHWKPPQVPADGRYVAHATFAEPGTYVLRGRADDGALVADADVTVTVVP